MNNRRQEISKKLHEMVLIYNAVMDGWIVKKKSDGRIKFYKKGGEEKVGLNVDSTSHLEKDEIQNFIDKYTKF